MNLKALALVMIASVCALPAAQAHRSQIWLKFEVPAGQELLGAELRLPVFMETVEAQLQLEIETGARRALHKTNDDPVLKANSQLPLTSEDVSLLREDLKTLRAMKTNGVWNSSLPLSVSGSNGETAFLLKDARSRTGQALIAELNIMSEEIKPKLKPETRAWFEKLTSELTVRVMMKDLTSQTIRYSARIEVPDYGFKERDKFIATLHQSFELQRSRRDDDRKFRASLLRTDKPEPKDWSGANSGAPPR